MTKSAMKSGMCRKRRRFELPLELGRVLIENREHVSVSLWAAGIIFMLNPIPRRTEQPTKAVANLVSELWRKVSWVRSRRCG